MRYRKSSLGKLKETCFGIYCDYRKTAAAFCCYSLLGTILILGCMPSDENDGFFYSLSGQTADENKHDPLTARAAASDEGSIQNAVKKLTSQTTTYRLTGTVTESDIKNAQNSQLDAANSTAELASQETAANNSTPPDVSNQASSDQKNNDADRKKSDYRISDFSQKEIRILERIVEAEAGDQPVKGRTMVAHVVLNRVASDEFPDTIKEVVFQHNGSVYQFSPIMDGRYYDVNISKKTKKAVAKAFESEDLTDGALYFMARAGSSEKNIEWFDSSLTRITSFGCHEFFK